MKSLIPIYSECTVRMQPLLVESKVCLQVGLYCSPLQTSRADIFLPELSQRRALNQCTSSPRDSSSIEIELRQWLRITLKMNRIMSLKWNVTSHYGCIVAYFRIVYWQCILRVAKVGNFPVCWLKDHLWVDLGKMKIFLKSCFIVVMRYCIEGRACELRASSISSRTLSTFCQLSVCFFLWFDFLAAVVTFTFSLCIIHLFFFPLCRRQSSGTQD